MLQNKWYDECKLKIIKETSLTNKQTNATLMLESTNQNTKSRRKMRSIEKPNVSKGFAKYSNRNDFFAGNTFNISNNKVL